MVRKRVRVTALIAAMAMPIFSLVGCGSAVTDPSISKASTATLPVMQGHTSYPLTVTSCGVSQVFESAPKRAVTLTSTATETMLELGLEKRMVGTAYQRNRPIGSQYKKAYDSIPILASGQPSMEKLLSVNPDFVYSGYPDGFSKSNGHTREDLKKLGIKTHLSPVGCSDQVKNLEDETREIRTIGQIFDVNDKAEKAVRRFNSKVSSVKNSVKGKDRPKVFLYNSGIEAPITVGGWAYASVMIDAAGGENIFAHEPLRWGKMSWEQVAKADPDMILIYDYKTPSVDQKIKTLKSIPALKDTKAVKNNAFPVISLSLAQPGPRSAEGIEQLAKQFHS